MGKTLRIIAIVFMGLTAAMNILGGIGTVCAAFLTKKFPPMWALLDYQWLYQILMIVTILIGLGGVWALIRLIKGGKTAYRDAMILLVVGAVVAGVHMYASLALRGKAVPANVKFYINAITLLIFLLLRLPGIREQVRFSDPSDPGTRAAASGAAAIIVGLVVLSTTLWVGESHIYQGANWTHVLKIPLMASGLALLTLGALRLALDILPRRWRSIFARQKG